MPAYDYGCECGHEKEVTHSILKKPRIKCKCGKRMEKLLSISLVKWGTDCPSASAGKECEK